jgi:soluble lytic murein transglycosylase-like protein
MSSMGSGRRAFAAVALTAVLVTAGCGLLGGGGDTTLPYAAPTVIDEPTTDPTTPDAPVETTPAPRPSSKKPKPKATSATPTVDPNWDQAPACATFSGPKISRTKIKSALQSAAKRQYWRTEAPALRVSYPLVKAIAWQESGWQQNIRNCDGGVGVMQAMPDTVDHMNLRFGLDYDPENYQDNAYVGANYLAWLTKYFGDEFFKGSYDLSTGKCKTHSSLCLLNLVIAAYNAGHGEVDAAYLKKKLPSPAYVDSVRSLMSSCYCDRF